MLHDARMRATGNKKLAGSGEPNFSKFGSSEGPKKETESAKGGEQQEDGDKWDFWCRVYDYENPERHELVKEQIEQEQGLPGDDDEPVAEPNLSEVLGSLVLQKTKLIVGNVPEWCSELEVRQLIESGIQRCSSVMHLKRAPNGKRCECGIQSCVLRTVQFYRAEDAVAAARWLPRTCYRGAALYVADCDWRPWNANVKHNFASQSFDNRTCSDESFSAGDGRYASFPEKQKPAKFDKGWDSDEQRASLGFAEPSSAPLLPLSPPLLPLQPEGGKHAVTCSAPKTVLRNVGVEQILEFCTPLERENAELEFFGQVAELLRSVGPLCYLDERVTRLICSTVEPLRSEILQWRLSAFRRTRLMLLVGKYLYLPQDEMQALDCCLSKKSGTEPAKETWEPFAPSTIYDDFYFTRFAEALLKRFGPLSAGSRVFGAFVQSVLCDSYRSADRDALIDLLDGNSDVIAVVDDVLFLVDSRTQRVEATTAIQEEQCTL